MDERKKRKLIERTVAKLLELAPTMLFGTLSETYRTCGHKGCRCHRTGPKHGPHLYLSYRGEHGRTTGAYVRKALEAQVRQGVADWQQFQQLAKELAQLNQRIVFESTTKPSGTNTAHPRKRSGTSKRRSSPGAQR